MRNILISITLIFILAGGLFFSIKYFSSPSAEDNSVGAEEENSIVAHEQLDEAEETVANPQTDITESDRTSASEVEEIEEEPSSTDHEKSSTTSADEQQYEEFLRINDHINIEDYYADVVEDNRHKRVVLFSDTSNHKQYKSIYVKHKNLLKLIDFNDGLIYKGQI